MKLDPKMIEGLLALPNDRLWETVRQMAASKHIRLSETPPPDEVMAKLRGAFADPTKMDLSTAVKVLSQYRNKK